MMVDSIQLLFDELGSRSGGDLQVGAWEGLVHEFSSEEAAAAAVTKGRQSERRIVDCEREKMVIKERMYSISS